MGHLNRIVVLCQRGAEVQGVPQIWIWIRHCDQERVTSPPQTKTEIGTKWYIALQPAEARRVHPVCPVFRADHRCSWGEPRSRQRPKGCRAHRGCRAQARAQEPGKHVLHHFSLRKKLVCQKALSKMHRKFELEEGGPSFLLHLDG